MGGKVSFPRTPLSKDKVVIVTGGNTGKFSFIILLYAHYHRSIYIKTSEFSTLGRCILKRVRFR